MKIGQTVIPQVFNNKMEKDFICNKCGKEGNQMEILNHFIYCKEETKSTLSEKGKAILGRAMGKTGSPHPIYYNHNDVKEFIKRLEEDFNFRIIHPNNKGQARKELIQMRDRMLKDAGPALTSEDGA